MVSFEDDDDPGIAKRFGFVTSTNSLQGPRRTQRTTMRTWTRSTTQTPMLMRTPMRMGI
ncbi:hypothetical protein LTR28_007995 [Elasticomyces elasticus]|nr:hypothetical protein LTR28_007995 [Elasticomyces elasticus]